MSDATPSVAVIDVDLENRFTYHPPKPGQPARYEVLRQCAKSLAYVFKRECPSSKELDQAIDLLDLALMRANAAISRHE